ncbi:MAG: M48 family metallopeptidase [Tannerellaceae bacterium]
MRILLLSLFFAVSISLTASAQFTIGGRTIDTKRVISAATDLAKAVTLSDKEIASAAREYIAFMDKQNKIAGPETKKGKRLVRLTRNLKKIEGLDLNFKVYDVKEVNAFACGDGSIRVYGGLMDVMTDAELMAVVGHEIGHVLHTDVKDAMKNAYISSAAKNVLGATDGIVRKLTDSQLGSLAQALSSAQFSQKQELEADDYAFQFSINNQIDPYGMSKALTKLVSMNQAGGTKASIIQNMFSTHPDSEKRAVRMKAKADEYTKNK